MFILQTIDEYLENPMGKGSTAISNRKLIQNDLNDRYDELIKKHKDFKHYIYHDNINFYIHILIPSESERDNTYDVVIEFTPSDQDVSNDVTLKRYHIKVFSNCPSFTYTYAYVYNNYDMMIDFLRNKYDSIVLRDNPTVKNPGEIINYEKSIYFACKYISSHSGLMNKLSLSAISKKINKVDFSKTIRNTDKIELEIKKENNRLKDEKQKKIDKLKKTITGTKDRTSPENIVKKITGTKKREDHRITPHPKIKGKAKVKSTVKK